MDISEKKFLCAVFFLALTGGMIGFRIATSTNKPTSKTIQNNTLRKLQIKPSELFQIQKNNKPVLIEFIDYECPPCKIINRKQLPKLIHDKNLLLIIKNYPLKIHPHAFEAAVCSEFAKSEKMFDSFHNKLLESQSLSFESINKLATDLKIKRDPIFRKKMESNVENDYKLAQRLGLPGTPSFVLCKPDGTVWYIPDIFEQIDLVLK